ncbi:oligosaccharide flippase family protein [uncultured Ruminococcus sp.]|uniref:oligosaccharide flippase family protein n=1 Tax=uncultured Ruminococcus sp. TaxID=165186 RepID=UPI00260C4E44|nr:oligosaccharide flippase family protein [uncultured Ruminococcus sp.]
MVKLDSIAEKVVPQKFLDKYRSFPVTLRAAFWFTVCNFVLKGISFICMPIYARFLSEEEYGTMSLITSYELIFTIFATFELYLGAFQRGLLKYKDDVKNFEQTIVFISNVLTVICFFIFMLLRGPLSGFTGVTLALYSLFSLYFIFYTPYHCWLNRKRFEYDYKAAVTVTILMALVSNLAPIITIKLFGATAYIKVISTLAIQIVFCLPFWIKHVNFSHIFKNTQRFFNYVKYAIRFQGPLVFHSLSYYVLNQSDRVMIDKFSSKADVAFYSVAYSFASVIIIFQNSLNQVLKPWRFQKLDKKGYKDVRDISNVLVILVGGVIVMFMLLLPEVFLIFPESYHQALKVAPPVTIGVYFLFLYTLFVDVESYYGKTEYIAYVSTFCALLNIGLNYVGIKMFGYVACAYTTLICYALMSFLHYVFMLITCKKAHVEESPVDSKTIWGFSLIMLAIFGVANAFYDSILVRYIIVACIVAAVIVFRKKLMSSWKMIRSK